MKEWIDLFSMVYEKNKNIRGIIVGDGILKEEILTHLKLRKMEEAILFPGLQTEVMPWLSAMDIFMMTSEFEGLPIALLEAMSMECVVMSTNAGGVGEVIQDKKDGFLVGVADWKELAIPLQQLIQSPQLIKSWGAKARERVIESFSVKKMTQELEALYRNEILQSINLN